MTEYSVEPISSEDKAALISKILASRRFAVKGDRASAILRFLFEQHCLDGASGPNPEQVFQSVYGSFHVDDKGGTVRSAIQRIKGMLDHYFEKEGYGQALRLTIANGRYALEFKRIQLRPEQDQESAHPELALTETEDVTDWLWRAYYEDDAPVSFGIVPDPSVYLADDEDTYVKGFPEEPRTEELLPSLRTVERFARLLSEKGKFVEIAERGWELDDGRQQLGKAHNILIGSDTCIPTRQQGLSIILGRHVDIPKKSPRHSGDLLHEPPPEAPWTDHQTWTELRRRERGLSGLGSGYFKLNMFRDPANKTAVLVTAGKSGTSTCFCDAPDGSLVLLTRYTVPQRPHRELTLITAREVAPILQVSSFVTSIPGMTAIEARPEFRQATEKLRNWKPEEHNYRCSDPEAAYRGGAPTDFQVLFRVCSHDECEVTSANVMNNVKIEFISIPDPWIGRAWW